MKTLKIFSICVIAVLLSACDTAIREPAYASLYTYHNQSSYDITIHIDCPVLEESETYEIPQSKSQLIYSRSIGDYPREPFNLYMVSPSAYIVTISNGEVEIYNSYSGEKGLMGLFDNSLYKYIRTENDKHHRYYEYTFTDDFFKNAYPEE